MIYIFPYKYKFIITEKYKQMKRKLISFFIALFIIANIQAQDQYLGEIKICSFDFAPMGWAFCEGQLLPIAQNQALFSLLGTTYGGNGTTNFALPDLRGRMVIGTGTGYLLGQRGGEEAHTLVINEMPMHNHVMNGTSDPATTDKPTSTPMAQMMLAAPTDIVFPQVTKKVNTYTAPGSYVQLSSQTSGSAGGSQPHNNMMPYITVRYIIAIQGIYPSRN